MLIKFILLLLITHFSLQLSSQTQYPANYFGSPIDFTPSLSGTFAEIRSGHLHSGIDYRTQGVEGKPLYAAAGGFVSRIRISPVGFGKALYIAHPNGFTTVYAHVRNFAPHIQQYILSEQYKRESFDVDLYPEPDKFPVIKGEVIAWSGNSGSSSGPHLHFEIRHTHNQNPINPKLFGFNIRDDIPPVMQALKIYPANVYTSINGSPESLVLDLAGGNERYRLIPDQTIHIAGEVAFGIQAYDQQNHSNFRNGVVGFNVFIDDEQVFACRIDEFSFSETRYVNAVIDYEEFVRNRRRFIQTRVLPNNPLNIYPVIKNGGIFSFSGTKNHKVRIEVEDAAGNLASLKFKVAASPPSLERLADKNINEKKRFRYNQINRFQTSDFMLEMQENALYEDIGFTFSEADPVSETLAKLFYVHDIYTPVHRNYTLAIKPENLDSRQQSKVIIVRKDDKDEWVSEGGQYRDGFVTTTTRSFGVFSLMIDTIAPQIRPVNISQNKNIAQQKEIRIRISDELTGIKSYRGAMNGKWILMDYDPKSELLVYEIDERTQIGANHFRLVVEDHAGNEASYEARLLR
jgi:hypothetical protein